MLDLTTHQVSSIKHHLLLREIAPKMALRPTSTIIPGHHLLKIAITAIPNIQIAPWMPPQRCSQLPSDCSPPTSADMPTSTMIPGHHQPVTASTAMPISQIPPMIPPHSTLKPPRRGLSAGADSITAGGVVDKASGVSRGGSALAGASATGRASSERPQVTQKAAPGGLRVPHAAHCWPPA